MDGTHFDFDETTRQLQARLDQLEAEHRQLDEQVTAQQLAGADIITPPNARKSSAFAHSAIFSTCCPFLQKRSVSFDVSGG